jgi:predicted ATPase/transcriptional regulator with XRE-family HTH domain
MTTVTSFGAWIRQRRRTLDMTQEELAAHVGCSLSAIRKIEADDRRPSRQVADLLAETLRIPQEERPTFLRIARMELATPHLATLEQAPTPTLASFSLPALNPAHNENGDNNAAGGALFSRRSLPTPPTPLVGRADEVARVAALLGESQCRLLTLVGPGGVGKTRLAIAVADMLRAGYSDGVTYVGLAGVDAPDAIVDAVAGALGFIFHGATAASTQLINFLRPKRILIVLDNLEHLLVGVDVLLEILEQALSVTLLATSRESLGLPGEWVYEVHGLPVVDSPSSNREQVLTTDAEQTAAAQLFLQAARRANPEFSAGVDDLLAIERICQLVEGLPLGIELAAAWVRMLTCQEIAHEIERSLDFLRTTARGVPPRQRSLRAAFDYSWGLLEDDEQVLLRRLAVFSGGFTQPAAAAVANATLPALSTLLAKSLVYRDDRGRYHLHETVRQYAVERLIDASEDHSLQMRQFAYFLTLAQKVDAARSRSDYLTQVDQLCAERDNLQAVLTWAFANDDVQVLQLVELLEPYLRQRPVRDAQTWLERSLELAERQSAAISDSGRARLFWVAAMLAQDQDRSISFARQTLEFARRAGEERLAVLAMSQLVNQGIFDGNYEQSETLYADALQIAQRLNDKVTLLQVYAARVELERYQGNYGRAIELCSIALALAQEAGRSDWGQQSFGDHGQAGVAAGRHPARPVVVDRSGGAVRHPTR